MRCLYSYSVRKDNLIVPLLPSYYSSLPSELILDSCDNRCEPNAKRRFIVVAEDIVANIEIRITDKKGIQSYKCTLEIYYFQISAPEQISQSRFGFKMLIYFGASFKIFLSSFQKNISAAIPVFMRALKRSKVSTTFLRYCTITTIFRQI
ncbi:MAG: hypothetical protein EZS28_017314 [Streblomastix strix]|uniref:Uncharacterized protein n=1 Tax=Streblomastix strix TaxID=222440 RepID=A0A5J4VX73_9EUKA|nr:MAG: hypothetical protein EZS28_017314 [Streblomastix strix]